MNETGKRRMDLASARRPWSEPIDPGNPVKPVNAVDPPAWIEMCLNCKKLPDTCYGNCFSKNYEPAYKRPIPEGFSDAYRSATSNRELAQKYKASLGQIEAWRDALGLAKRKKTGRAARPMPDDFRDAVAMGWSVNRLRQVYKSSHETVRRWLAEIEEEESRR